MRKIPWKNIKKKVVIFFFLIIVLCICSVILYFFSYLDDSKDRHDNAGQWKDERLPIVTKFPYFENSSKIFWKSGRLGKQSFFNFLGPSAYWIKGYIFCEYDLLETEKDRGDWRRAQLHIDDEFLLQGMAFTDNEWMFSPSFNKALVGHKYHGKFYYYPEHNLVFFDLFWGG